MLLNTLLQSTDMFGDASSGQQYRQLRATEYPLATYAQDKHVPWLANVVCWGLLGELGMHE